MLPDDPFEHLQQLLDAARPRQAQQLVRCGRRQRDAAVLRDGGKQVLHERAHVTPMVAERPSSGRKSPAFTVRLPAPLTGP